jgi:hypothetical protein
MLLIKSSRALLAPGVRSEDTASAIQTDRAARELRLYLDVTDAPGSGGLTVVIRGRDKISGRAVELSTGGALVTAAGTYCYELSTSPDPVFGNVLEAVSRTVPYRWDAVVKHADGASYTYSLSAEITG